MQIDCRIHLGRALMVLALSMPGTIGHAGPVHSDPIPGGGNREGPVRARLQLPVALVDEAGLPVTAGGRVVVRCAGGESEPVEVEGGVVEIEGPSEATGCQVWARAPSRGFCVTAVELPIHSDATVRLDLPDSGAVRLRLVSGLSGEYLEADVVWRLRWRATPAASEFDVPVSMFDGRQSEPDRDWLLTGLPLGLYVVEISVEGYAPRIIEGVRLASLERPLDLGDVTLSPVARLCGRVDGHTAEEPVAVRWRRVDGVADGSAPVRGGTFCIEGLAAGREHAVWAVAGGRESEAVRVVLPRDDVELTASEYSVDTGPRHARRRSLGHRGLSSEKGVDSPWRRKSEHFSDAGRGARGRFSHRFC